MPASARCSSAGRGRSSSRTTGRGTSISWPASRSTRSATITPSSVMRSTRHWRAAAGRGRRPPGRSRVARVRARAVRRAGRGADLRRGAVRAGAHGNAVRLRAGRGRPRHADPGEAARRWAADGCRAPDGRHRGGLEAGGPRDDVRRWAAGRARGPRGRAHDRRAGLPRRRAGPRCVARRVPRRRRGAPQARGRGAGARPDVGDRADGARRSLRRGGARTPPARRHGGSERDPSRAAARRHAGGAGARRRDPGGGALMKGAGSRELGAGSQATVLLPAPSSPLPGVAVRAAVLSDVSQLETLMAPYVATGDPLPRSNYDLCRHIKEYVVADALLEGGAIVGCGSLKVYSVALAEVAGLAVRADWQGSGIGRALLEALLAEARAYGLAEVLALTRKPTFFQKLGFVTAEREQFPLKVWADCARCPRQNCCDEIAVVLRL